jgi:hypothetical protein
MMKAMTKLFTNNQ